MKTFILFLIAIGLLYNAQSASFSNPEITEKSTLSFNLLEEELAGERVDNSEDEEKEVEKLDFLASNHIAKHLLAYHLHKNNTLTPTLLSYISPVFTPPPNLS